MRDGLETIAPDQVEVLPHSIEAEQALLGVILWENEALWQVAGWLRAEHFYDPTHGRLFERAASMIQAGKLADVVKLKAFAEEDEGLKELGGGGYLLDLVREAPEPVTIKDYADMVVGLSQRRALIAACQSGVAKARAEDGDEPDAIVEAVSSELFKLAETKASGGLESFADAMDEWIAMAEAAYKSGKGISGVPTGLRSLDTKLGGLAPSDLIILAGRPSMGKSALALNIAINAAKAGHSVGLFSLEMSAAQLAGRQLAAWTGISTQDARSGNMGAAQAAEMRSARERMASLPLRIDDTGGISPSSLTARCRRMKRTHGLDLIIIDYLQLMRIPSSRENRVQEVSEITAALKTLAKELNVPVLALSQLSRQVEQREDKRPQLSDLRESGSIEQDADVVMFCYREAYYHERLEPKAGTEEWLAWEDTMKDIANQAEVIIGKQRHGPIGTVKLSFTPETTQFADLEEGR